MPIRDENIKTGRPSAGQRVPPVPVYNLTFLDSTSSPVNLFRQIIERIREPKAKLRSQYYRGELATLPVTEMRPWYRDLPKQIKILFEKPTDPIGIFNRRQDQKRALVGLAMACLGAATGWAVRGGPWIALGIAAGYPLGLVAGVLLFKKREYPPDCWQDYQPQAGSWLNSLLVHAVGLALLILPFVIGRSASPVKAAPKYEVTDLSPYLNQLPPSPKKAGGGGGGGDRSPTPASKGAVPKFSREQLAPPMVRPVVEIPKLPVQPSLLGPPELKLAEMQSNVQMGDPKSLLAQLSNGPGFGGGIGTGRGGGIGSGDGGGLGPGSGGGTGGGLYSVGGGVSAPIPIYQPEPPYSEEARKAKYTGTVVLWIIVDAQGRVGNDVRVVKPLGLGLDEKAVETVRTWKFKPALNNGTPVPVRVMVEVTFRLF